VPAGIEPLDREAATARSAPRSYGKVRQNGLVLVESGPS